MNLPHRLVVGFFALVTAAAISQPVLRVARAAEASAFADLAAVETWAKKSFFGGASVKTFSKDGRELVVVTGQPTSGLLTSHLVILGRGATKERYQVVLRTAVFMGHVKVRQEGTQIAADLEGTVILRVPFALAAQSVHSGI